MPFELFVANSSQLCGLLVLVFVAGTVRGALGFGFSAIVIACGSLFLPLVI